MQPAGSMQPAALDAARAMDDLEPPPRVRQRLHPVRSPRPRVMVGLVLAIAVETLKREPVFLGWSFCRGPVLGWIGQWIQLRRTKIAPFCPA